MWHKYRNDLELGRLILNQFLCCYSLNWNTPQAPMIRLRLHSRRIRQSSTLLQGCVEVWVCHCMACLSRCLPVCLLPLSMALVCSHDWPVQRDVRLRPSKSWFWFYVLPVGHSLFLWPPPFFKWMGEMTFFTHCWILYECSLSYTCLFSFAEDKWTV